MSAKKIVTELYASEALIKPKLLATFLHPEFHLEWHSITGLIQMNRTEFIEFAEKLGIAYERLFVRINQITKDKGVVSARGNISVRILENPSEQIYLSNFMAMWEVKDDLIYRGYHMNQHA